MQGGIGRTPAASSSSSKASSPYRLTSQASRVARLVEETIEELSEIHSTSGQHDLLAKLYLNPGQDVGLFVTERVQALPEVADTPTLIAFNTFAGASREGPSPC